MRIKLLYLIVLAIFFNSNSYAMGKKVVTFDNIYKENGHIFTVDAVYHDGYQWCRRDIDVSLFTSLPGYPPYTYYIDELILCKTPAPVELPNVYEREDLIFYNYQYNPILKKMWKRPFSRRRSEKIIVTDKKFNKPYIRLGTFTQCARKPSNNKPVRWQKYKSQIQSTGYVDFGSDAVIVESWEEIEFKQEDYWPITRFQDPTFIRFNCVAVAFEETAEIPKYVKIIVQPLDGFNLPYTQLGRFTITCKNFIKRKKIQKKALKEFNADAVLIEKTDILLPAFSFFPDFKRYHCIAIKLDHKSLKNKIK